MSPPTLKERPDASTATVTEAQAATEVACAGDERHHENERESAATAGSGSDSGVSDMHKDTTDGRRKLSSRTLLEAGGAFAGGAFLAGTYFGLVGAVVGSVLGFAIVIVSNLGGGAPKHEARAR